jgi:hypothetical protein
MVPIRNPKSLAELVEEQCTRWKISQTLPSGADNHRGLILISRQAASIAPEVGKILSRQFTMDFHGDDILSEIAKQTHLSERIIRMLDEKGRSYAEEIIAAVEHRRGIPPEEYFKHLVRIILTIAQHRNCIVLGHGAPYILRDPAFLRVRFIAPQEVRATRMSEEHSLSLEEATRRIRIMDDEHKRFLRQYFHMEGEDDHYFDLVLNEAFIDVESAVHIVGSALVAKTRQYQTPRQEAV